MFDIGWVRTANPTATIAAGEIVAVEAHTLGLWTVNLSRIMDVIDEPTEFGFRYATTPDHVEEGVEQFLISLDRNTEAVLYSLKAISRPRAQLARIGYPFTRSFQRRFARDSHARMRQAVASLSC